jgi:hypothetical protein
MFILKEDSPQVNQSIIKNKLSDVLLPGMIKDKILDLSLFLQRRDQLQITALQNTMIGKLIAGIFLIKMAVGFLLPNMLVVVFSQLHFDDGLCRRLG